MHLPVPIEVLLSNHDLLIPIAFFLGILLIITIPVSGWLARRTGSARWLTFMFLLGGAGVLAITLPLHVNYYGFLSCVIQNPLQAANVWDSQNYLNAVLYFPVALFGHLVFRRTFVTIAILASGSAAIETIQMFSDRVCSTTDFIFNLIGGLAGIITARILVMATHKTHEQRLGDERHTDSVAP
ncbi:glycopeptide antibiotics resistance protein [Streptosporangium becharense]|uniref:Glycopeptide antibiotics resistance protein n=1 Tax=Streptosporangium becharense TaxID=1816182 RepID=A0A7W9IGG3_9ACTN|nr:VanZ family protein [Streptosporangium becharense]MBB2914884.1 glycopeptide antibiotics resistance protein [Streptosporangium becharense]MBB5820305.1 glycopeptide antibiotics resistance protein [Streptosporangium becharense]